MSSGGSVFSSSIILPKTIGTAIKVDTTTPTYAWHDLTSDIAVKGSGVNNPPWATYRGAISAYQFGSSDECWLSYHIPHDYAPGTDMFIHAHWSHNSASVTTGGVNWTFNVSYAKGHNQSAFTATVAPAVTQTASTTQYQHMIAEVQMSASSPSVSRIDTDDIEIDGLILVHLKLTGNTMSAATDPFLHFVDIHYQSTNIGTKAKAPDFYT